MLKEKKLKWRTTLGDNLSDLSNQWQQLMK